jgi:hypothetical protein
MGRNVCSLSMTGMQALCQCKWSLHVFGGLFTSFIFDTSIFSPFSYFLSFYNFVLFSKI